MEKANINRKAAIIVTYAGILFVLFVFALCLIRY